MNEVMPFRKIVGIYSEEYAKCIKTLSGKKCTVLNVKADGAIVVTVL
jgi:hypothetical protein